MSTTAPTCPTHGVSLTKRVALNGTWTWVCLACTHSAEGQKEQGYPEEQGKEQGARW